MSYNSRCKGEDFQIPMRYTIKPKSYIIHTFMRIYTFLIINLFKKVAVASVIFTSCTLSLTVYISLIDITLPT